ncbi:MAG: molybdenum ABC transporter ATP-binding protein [Chitinophagaceae bacterium]|nr:molybdenum ABC transporter ATP-binding protein [Rubrivivax sp.]
MVSRLELDVRLEFAGEPPFRLAVQAEMPLDGITAVFGPSGCGKSTLLRIVAGLEPTVHGSLRFDGETWLGPAAARPVPAHRRGVGLVFQDARLFTHLDVEGNLRYADSRSSRIAGGRIAWSDVVDVLDLAPLLRRRTAQLSGGERQRVAIGRTLLARPRLLLMDEPLAALDTGRKAEILPYIERLPEAFGVPVLYVTHDMDEVARLASRMLLLHAGRVRAAGPLAEVLEQLYLPGVGAFEAGVVLCPRVVGHDRQFQLLLLDLSGQRLTVPVVDGLWPAVGTGLRLRVRARDVALATHRPQGLSMRNVLQGTLTQLTAAADGPQAEALVDVGGGRLRARLTRHAVAELGLTEGQTVFALIKGIALDGSAASD